MQTHKQYSAEELRYLKMLSRQYPTVRAAGTEIINLQAILNLPKGCEHFISDVHGEHEAFLHILNSCSGVIRERLDALFRTSVPRSELDELATLIYYPEEKLEDLKPRIRDLGEDAVKEFESQMAQMQTWYQDWQEKLGKGEGSNEDARFVLPNACETHITMTMNARELLHFFSLRCCNRAQWEIRALAREMLRLCKQVSPVIFESAGPGCVRGACPEGAKSCGQQAEMRLLYKNL